MRHGAWRDVMTLLMVSLAGLACREDEPYLTSPPPARAISLDTVLVDPADVWLQLKLADNRTGSTVQLYRNDSVQVFSGRVVGSDTTIVDDMLQPKTKYRYKAYRLQRDSRTEFTPPLFVTTMDTSSHSFTWQVQTLGEFGGHGLQDVAIINDTCVWAVGMIYLSDSTGGSTGIANAARWDGRQWNNVRVSVRLDYGTSVIITDQDPLTAVFAPTPNDVWFVSLAGGVTRYLNGQWVLMKIPYPKGPGGANKIWGPDSSNVYFAANNGCLTRYTGTQWQTLESGTTLDITDIYGATNPKTSELEIIAVASMKFETFDRRILKINGNTVTMLSDNPIIAPLSGVWFVPGRSYYVAGWGVYMKTYRLDASYWSHILWGGYETYYQAVRGNASNDVVVACVPGDVYHFDGYLWRTFPEASISDGFYNSVAMRGNLVVAVGYENGRSVVAVGKRP